MADIKVESFDVDVTTDGSTHTLTNDVGDVNSAFIKRGTTRKSSGGLTTTTGNTAPNQGNVGIHLSDTDEITFERLGTTSAKIMGEVWRYTGASGGSHEFIVRGRVAVTLASLSTSGSAAISGIVDEDACVPFVTGLTTNSSSVSDWETGTVAVHMDGSGNVVASRGNSAQGVETIVYIDVVEFTGSAWSVGHAISTSHDTVDVDLTMNTDSDGASGSTFDVSDWDTAFIEGGFEGDTSETGLADTLGLILPGPSTTQVRFEIHTGDNNARNDGDAWIHIVQNDDLAVYRRAEDNYPEANGTYTTATWPTGAPTDKNLDELALEWYSTTSGTGTAHMRGSLMARIADPTGTIDVWVHRSGNTVDIDYGVIDLSQLIGETVTPTEITKTAAYDVETVTEQEITKSAAYEVDAPGGPWYNASWLYRVKITVPAANINSTLTDFPVHVKLDDLPSGFHANTRIDAQDIRVTTSDMTTEVPREVVDYDATSDVGEMHFKAPSLSSSVDTDFYIYYGNASANDYAIDATYGAENVWTNDYAAVYHGVNNGVDSTSNDNDMTANGNATIDATSGSPFAGHMVFDGTGDYYSIGSLSGGFSGGTAMTVSAWYYLDSLTGDGAIFSVEDTSYDIIMWYNEVGNENDGGITFNSGSTGSQGNRIDGITDAVATTWTMTHAIHDGTNRRSYHNGAADGVDTGGTNHTLPSGTSTRIGSWQTSSGMDMDGSISGVRIANVARSADWIATEYDNQVDPDTFFTVGTQEQNSGAVPTEITKSAEYAVEVTTPTEITKGAEYDVAYTTYSYASVASLGTDDARLGTVASSGEFTNLQLDNNTFLDVGGANFLVIQQENYHTNATDNIVVTWKGKSSTAASTDTIYLQAYDYNTDAWVQIDSDSATAADTEFTLTSTLTSTDYYDTSANNKTTTRVYQEIT